MATDITSAQEQAILFMGLQRLGYDPAPIWNRLPQAVKDALLRLVGRMFKGEEVITNSNTVVNAIGSALWYLVPEPLKQLITDLITIVQVLIEDILGVVGRLIQLFLAGVLFGFVLITLPVVLVVLVVVGGVVIKKVMFS